jgi:amino acid transporter
LAAGGPGSLLLGFLIIGLDLLCTIYSLAEMTLVLPISGAFVVHATRFINKPWGFAMGWNYATQWLIVLPLELVALTIVFKYWHAVDKVTSAGLALIFWVIIIIINLFGVRGYGEAEMLFAILKIIAVVGFFVLGVAIDLGAGKTGTHIGGKYWHDPGAFTGGWCGFFTVLIIAAFSFSGTEMLCLAAGEHPKPIKVLPKAVKQVFWRIFLVRYNPFDVFLNLILLVLHLIHHHCWSRCASYGPSIDREFRRC